MGQSLYEIMKTILPEERIRENELMKNHTTFRIGGEADVLVMPRIEEIPKVLQKVEELQIPVTVIGNGSNLLVGDNGIRGLVLEIGKSAEYIEIEGTRLRIGAGTMLGKAAAQAAEAGLGGIEFAAGIPGSVGGAVVMNAGAYGGEMKDILVEVKVFTKDGKEQILKKEELDLSYRHSCIPEKEYIVAEAVVELQPKDVAAIREEMARLRQQRVDKQPLEYPSAGSTFKRPEGYFAGKLIMDAGLRGYQVGDAQVSEKHCGFVINRGNATASQVKQLMEDVAEKVYGEFQVTLEPEVKMIGEF